MQIAKRFFRPLEPRRILVIQLGDIGDVVWSLPALQAIGETYPEASVTVLLREGNGALLKADAMPPAVFEVPKALGGFLRHLFASMGLVLALRRQRFDLVFDLRGDERGGYMAFATGAPIRVAHYYPNLAWPRNQLFTHLVTLPVASQPIQRAAAASLDMLGAFDIKSTTVVPKLHLSAETRLCALKLLAEEGIVALQDRALRGMGADWLNASGGAIAGKNGAGERQEGVLPVDGKGAAGRSWVTVNPFSRWSYKEWRPDRWVQLIDWLRRQFGLTTVIVGTAGEREKAARIAAACSGQVHNLAGKSTLGALAGILERSRLHIGVDSAAPHIAAAVGTPTVTLYGPSDWRYWAPPGENHRVVTPTLDCAPCHRKGCQGGGMSRCLDELEVERVQAVIGAALSS
jgi:heptosyltransferase-3